MPDDSYGQATADLARFADKQRAQQAKRYFKTGPGQYGEGDVFIGVTVPNVRRVARTYKLLSSADITKLLHDPIHERRLLALLIMADQFKRGDKKQQGKLYRLYLENTEYINNWDLVDLSAPSIVGGWLMDRPRKVLHRLVGDKLVWNRRIALLATFQFIKHNDFKDSLKLATRVMHDEHDLIHKASGWMLRETGKRNTAVLKGFLDENYRDMPRTMLRYAIEKLPEDQRQAYLKGTV